ncbi:MAG: 50S ribosomal protein L17 [Leptospiraceae bacterium]|nr:50S ribosomal protein L17 [Leptospiraceae bacterium]
MNKRNKVSKLNRDYQHRQALLRNMATSLFEHERINSTIAKLKVLRSYAEKLITRAKRNVGLDLNDPTQKALALHNRREVMKKIKNEAVVRKLFDDIAPRFKDVNGGYTRIFRLVNRASDNSEMGILELTIRKTKEELKAQKLELAKQREEARKARKKELKAKREQAKVKSKAA